MRRVIAAGAAGLLLWNGAALASDHPELSAYVRARAAAEEGQVGVAAQGYALALSALPGDEVIAIRAYREAMASGDIPLALRAAEVLERSRVAPADTAIIAIADAVAAGDASRLDAAIDRLSGSPLEFMTPIIRAWVRYDSDPAAAIELLNGARDDALSRRYVSENRALMQIGSGDITSGIAALRTLLGADRGSLDLRLNAAQLLGGQRQAAAGKALLVGDDPVLMRLRHSLKGSKANARFGLSRLFTRLGGELTSDGTQLLAIVMARAALRLDPADDRARLILVDGLAREKAYDRALAVLDEIKPDSLFDHPARISRIFVLQRSGRKEQALMLAGKLAKGADASAIDARTYADLLAEHERFAEAADAYGLAMARGGAGPDWVANLQRGGALERAGRWNEALPFLKRAVELAPDEPSALNYLGYAQAERGENLDAALALLERASALSPDDPAITDSLGWAYFQTGKTLRALPLLERAARAEPSDATIQEHLGDAYWKLGRRYEARYAWRAARMVASDRDMARIDAKLRGGPQLARR